MKTLALSIRQRLLMLFVILLSAFAATAQTTTFTYQGKLPDEYNQPTALYDLQFNLYDEASGTNAPLNATPVVIEDMLVTNGTFTVSLNFSNLFNTGADRYLEIGIRPSDSTGAFTLFSSRAQITSAPYSIRSLSAATADTAVNAQNLGGTTSGNFVQTTDSRLTDARTPTAGSASYIQNRSSVQSGSNFNISGNGVATNLTATGTLSGGVVNATTQINISGTRVLSTAGTDNIFAGNGAGISNTAGSQNVFVGASAGLNNTEGRWNTYVGFQAGSNPATLAGANTFVGYQSGLFNRGSYNSIFGHQAGGSSGTGSFNSFFGQGAGASNTLGNDNVFVGDRAGVANSTGSLNVFLGFAAGDSNTTGSQNTAVGIGADVTNGNLTHATAIGADATVSSSDTIVLGRSARQDTVQIPGNLNVSGTISGNINGSNFTNLNASNITTGTLNNARLGLISTSNIADNSITTVKLADSAITAPKIGSNQVVKNLNGLTDSVNLAAGANVTITPSGNTLTIAAAGGGGSSQWTTSGSNIAYNSGNVGIGTTSPGKKLEILATDGEAIRVYRTVSSAGWGVNMKFAFNNSNNAQFDYAGVHGMIQANTAGAEQGTLLFTTATAGSLTEKVRIDSSGNVGVGTVSPTSKLHVVGDGKLTGNLSIDGNIQLNTLGTAGGSQLCRNASNQIANCSSSLRYKTNIAPFSFGLNLVRRLHPIRFEWKAGGMKDLGFGAEDVAAVEPLLVTYNEQGDVEGVKYDRISAVLVNAVKEQQSQIEAQKAQLEQQQLRIDGQQKQLVQQQGLIEGLKRVLCSQDATAAVCH